MDVIDTFRLNGKVALVTGGAGLYGRQITEALAEAGASVIIASRNVQTLERQAAVWSDSGLNVRAISFDQNDEGSVRALLGKATDPTGRVDVLINNAVLRPMTDWACDNDAEQFSRSMAVNATGLYLMLRHFGEHMAENGDGSIINIGSIQGMVGPDFTLYEGLDWGTLPDYFFHKAGMINLTRYAAAKLGPRGVRVNTLSPGGFFSNQDSSFVERYNGRTFLGRLANDTDIKGAIVFLASDASAYVTGANLVIDGGYTSK